MSAMETKGTKRESIAVTALSLGLGLGWRRSEARTGRWKTSTVEVCTSFSYDRLIASVGNRALPCVHVEKRQLTARPCNTAMPPGATMSRG
jgi:hypothetical protein